MDKHNLHDALLALHCEDYVKALHIMRFLALAGDSTAQYNMGIMHEKGVGVTADSAEAFKWFALAAEQGHIKAQQNLGVMYAEGKGTRTNRKRAFKWFSAAADAGDVKALYNLGLMYMNGLGVTCDKEKAMECFHEAARQQEKLDAATSEA